MMNSTVGTRYAMMMMMFGFFFCEIFVSDVVQSRFQRRQIQTQEKKKDPNDYLRHAFTLQNVTILNLNRYIYKHTRQSSLLRSGATSRAHTHKIDRNHFKCSLKTDKTDFLYFSFYVNTLKILNGSSQKLLSRIESFDSWRFLDINIM